LAEFSVPISTAAVTEGETNVEVDLLSVEVGLGEKSALQKYRTVLWGVPKVAVNETFVSLSIVGGLGVEVHRHHQLSSDGFPACA
jgi:ribosomal protein L19